MDKLSIVELLILSILVRNERELYGLEMVRLSNGKLNRNTLYVMLSRMEDKKLIKGRTEKKQKDVRGHPRRFYRPLAKGFRLVDEYQTLFGWG